MKPSWRGSFQTASTSGGELSERIEFSASSEGELESGTAAEGDLRWVAVDVTGPGELVRSRLDLSPVAAAALGRCLAGAAMLLRLSAKAPVRLVLEVRGDGPIRKVMAEADQHGNLRGLVGDPRVAVEDYPNGKLAVGAAVGGGQLSVLREYEQAGVSYSSRVRLVSGEIGEDLAHFLEQSEQTRNAVLVGVLTRPEGVAAAGGLVVEVLPGAREESISRLEENLGRFREVSRLLEDGGVERMKRAILDGLAPRRGHGHALRYHCRCSRERLLGHLLGLSEEQLEELGLDVEVAQAECGFCGEVYLFQPAELRPS